jgi:hypothetical protein
MWKPLLGALLGLSQLQAAQIPAEPKNSFQIISDLADEIKGCPASLYEEKHWGPKQTKSKRIISTSHKTLSGTERRFQTP